MQGISTQEAVRYIQRLAELTSRTFWKCVREFSSFQAARASAGERGRARTRLSVLLGVTGTLVAPNSRRTGPQGQGRRVGCENLVTPPVRTRGRRRRDGAEHEHHRMPTSSSPAVVAPVARATALDVAGARCNGPRRHRGSAQGAAGSESAAGRDIPSGRCARSVRRRRWLVAREMASARPRSRRCGTPRQNAR